MPTVTYAGTPAHFMGAYSGSYDCINQGRFYELPLLEYIRALGLGGTYLDIGTNIGNHALFFAMFCDCDRVIGFEPVPHWRARALDNLAANACASKVEVLPLGLLDRPQLIEFNPYGTAYQLDCRTLDGLLPDRFDVSFVKMDIEGSEPKALLGGREFFRRNRPVILAECLGNTGELAAAAESIGYRLTQRMPLVGVSPMYELLPA